MSLLSGIIVSPPLLRGFDADKRVTLKAASESYQAGYRFCLRYLSLDTEQGQDDLSSGEALQLLSVGLSLMAVQHVDYAGWSPTSSLGSTHGKNAAKNASSVGLPAGINLWCDLEGVSSKSSSAEVIDYCQSWYSEVQSAGYVPGLYVGPAAGLSGDQLYYDLSFQHYWKSGSDVPSVAARGYQMFQEGHDEFDGIEVDVDYAGCDQFCGQPLWLTPLAGK